MRNLYEKISDSAIDQVDKQTFKGYVLEKLEPVSQYIKKIKISKENRLGQWGIYVYFYDTISKTTGRFYNKDIFVPSDADDLFFEWTIEEVKNIYESPDVKIMRG